MVMWTTSSDKFVDKSCFVSITVKSHLVGEILCVRPRHPLAAMFLLVSGGHCSCAGQRGKTHLSDCGPLEVGEGSAHSTFSSVLFFEP